MKREQYWQTEEYQNLLERWATDIIFFGQCAVPRMFKVGSPDFHFEIEEVLKDFSIKFLNIIAPRGFAKTSLVGVLFVLWHIFIEHIARGREREHSIILLVSKTRGHAKMMLETIKQTLDTQEFRYLFGDWGEATARSWTRDEITLKDGTKIMCRGTGQQVRGIQENFLRPTLVIFDDPEDEENTKTAERMEDNLKWALQGLKPGLDKDRGRFVVIGTPQHQRCMIFTLRDDYTEEWHTLHYAAITEEGESLWPELHPLDELEAEKQAAEEAGRLSYFYREYLCEVISDEERTFDDWNWWEGSFKRDGLSQPYLEITHLGEGRTSKAEKLETPKKVPINVFMGVDPASSTNKNADASVIMAVAIDEENNRYILPYWRGREKPFQVGRAVIREYKKYRALLTRVESTGYQEMLRQFLHEEADVTIPGLSIKEVPRSKKSSRLEGMQPMFADGKVYIQKSMRALTDELLTYPGGKHDDTLDALYYATKRTYPPTHQVIGQKEADLGHGGKGSWKKRYAATDWMVR